MRKHGGKTNLTKERFVMMASTVLILGALTATGIYIRKGDRHAEDNGYTIDLEGTSADSERTEEIQPSMDDDLDYDPDALEVTSGSVDQEMPSDRNARNISENKKVTAAMDITEYVPSKKDDAPSTSQILSDVQEATTERESSTDDFKESNVEETSQEAVAMGVMHTLDFTEESSLVMPFVGDVLLNYSMDKSVYFETLQQYKVNPAVMLSAAPGTEVSAAAKGLVKEIKSMPVTGLTVVMDLGNHYQLTYGQLADLTVEEGNYVELGEKIGVVGTPSKYFTVEGPHLYMQLTKDGIPVNPLE